MTDIELTIKIPEEDYTSIKQGALGTFADVESRNGRRLLQSIISAVYKGTTLPKGHGGLIDKNEITAFRELECNGHNVESLDEFTVIIEADKAESEK